VSDFFFFFFFFFFFAAAAAAAAVTFWPLSHQSRPILFPRGEGDAVAT
jgi:hypothetical protein